MDKDIKALIGRYMDGLTTPAEERRIASYMQTYEPQSDEERTYKEMFAWLEGGMPVDAQGVRLVGEKQKVVPVRRKRGLVVGWACAVAAAVAFLFVLNMQTPEHQSTVAIAEKDTLRVDKTNGNAMETEAVDTANAGQPAVKRRIRVLRKYRYKPAPPEVLIAERKLDSISTLPDRLAEEKLMAITRRQDSLLRRIDFPDGMYQREGGAALMASDDAGDEYVIEEIYY